MTSLTIRSAFWKRSQIESGAADGMASPSRCPRLWLSRDSGPNYGAGGAIAKVAGADCINERLPHGDGQPMRAPRGRDSCRTHGRSSGRSVAKTLLIGPHGSTQRLWNRPRAPVANERDPQMRLDQKFIPSQDLLLQRDRRALDVLRPSHHHQDVVHACGFEELDLHRADDEGEARRLRARLFE